jgi:DNA-binding NtrC family response regulator
LVLDGSQLLAWTVKRLCPPDTEILGLTSFQEACRVVAEEPPDAAVIRLGSAEVSWRDLQRICASRTPPVPVLFQSSFFETPVEAGLEPQKGLFDFLRLPAPLEEVEAAVAQLLDRARESQRRCG